MFESKSLYLVWGTTDQGPRSRVMAEKLGIEIQFVYTDLPRVIWTVPLRYLIQTYKTFSILFRKRPQLIFVQNPPLLSVVEISVYCALVRANFIIDAHSDAFLARGWTAPPVWIKQYLAKKAIVTIVTNEHLEQLVESWGGKTMIISDIPIKYTTGQRYPVSDRFNVVLINTFSADEPLNQVIKAARSLPHVQFYVTGRISNCSKGILADLPPNIDFTDFLSDDMYYALLNSVDAVMCLTTRDHTMQRGACEALSIGKPIITSNWGLLREYFFKGTVHVDNTVDGIQYGVQKMMKQYDNFSREIKELQVDQNLIWENKIKMLYMLIPTHKSTEY